MKEYMLPKTNAGLVSVLAIVRCAQGLSLEELALRMQVAPNQVSLWERRVQEPTTAQKKRLGLAMGFPWRFLSEDDRAPSEACEMISGAGARTNQRLGTG